MPELTVVPPQAPSALERLVEDYLAACRARGLSPATVNNSYGYPLKRILLPFCGRRGIEEVAGLDNRQLNALSGELLEQGGARSQQLSKHSLHAYMRAINHFLSWARREGEEIRGRAELPKLPRRLVETLTRDELRAMEEAARTERDGLIVRLLADTGIRVGELVGLRIADLDRQPKAAFLRVRGKGGKDRRVPLAPSLQRRLLLYIERKRPRDTASERIFLSLKRRPGGDYAPLTTSGVDQLIRNLAQQAGIQKRVYPHLLRHSYATWVLTRGMNPLQLQQILGHSSMEMISRVYVHLTPQDSYDAMLKVLLAEDEE